MATTTKFTRREIATALSASAALLGQAPTPPLPQNSEEELKAARDSIRQNSEQLSKFPLAMSVEPAARFKA